MTCECGEALHTCDGCKIRFCSSCEEGRVCKESDVATCVKCEAKEAAYWKWYFGGAIKQAADARRDLDLPSSATDSEVCEAARRLK